jgi:hypothetical protein
MRSLTTGCCAGASDKRTIESMLRQRSTHSAGTTFEMGETLAVSIEEVAAALLIMALCGDERDDCRLHRGGRDPSTRHGAVEMARRWLFSACVDCLTCMLCAGRTFDSKSICGRSRVVDQKRRQRRREIVLKACCLLVTHKLHGMRNVACSIRALG